MIVVLVALNSNQGQDLCTEMLMDPGTAYLVEVTKDKSASRRLHDVTSSTFQVIELDCA